MMSRWLGGLAAAAVALVACVLVILDLTDAGLRRWWDAHALTTDAVAWLAWRRSYLPVSYTHLTLPTK